MAVEFSQETLKEFNEILKRYPTKRAASLPALHLARREFGYISDEAIEYVAKLIELTPAELTNVVSFYSMFYRMPMGRYVIQVCHTLSCSLLGAADIVEHFSRKLGIKPGETTEDNKFSLVKVECLGSCGTAPVFRINDVYYEGLTLEKIDELLNGLP